MEQKTVVALEIASSKIKGGIGSIGTDGHLTVLAVEEIPAVNNVRYGRVQNIREVSEALAEILSRLENDRNVAHARISGAVIAVGGRSVAGAPTTASLRFAHECEITEALVQRLIYEATRDYVGDRMIVDTLPRMFYVNNTAVKKAVGNFAETLRGEFTMVTCGKETRQNLDRLKYDHIDPEHRHYILRATAIADFVLSGGEKDLGCLLVDFGAETCTISVYSGGSLRFLSTLPMGSRLITLDIMAGVGVTEETAESFKTELATLGEDTGTGVNAVEISGYVRARAGEIAANILNQLNVSGYSGMVSKIVLTGGGAKLPEFASVLERQAKMPVRTAEMPQDVIFRTPGRNNADNIDIAALLWAARTFPKDEFLTVAAEAPVETPVETEKIDEAPDSVVEVVREVAVLQAGKSLFDDEKPEDHTRKKEHDEEPEVIDDDEDLLRDDPDDEEDDKTANTRRGFSLFGFGKGKKEKASHKDVPQEEPDDDDDEEEEENEQPEHSGAKDPEGVRRALDIMKDSIVRFFSTPEEEDEEEDEDK